MSEIQELSQKVNLKNCTKSLSIIFRKMSHLVAKFHNSVAEKPHPPRECGTE